MEQDFDKCKDNTNIIVQKSDDLGYRINRKKSVLSPTKRIVFFGLIIDTEVFKVFLTDEKVDKIISLGHSILQQKNVVIRCLASLNLPLADFKFEIYQLISFFESSLINTIDSKLPKEFLKAQTLFLSKFL
jgi:hypothetical protein